MVNRRKIITFFDWSLLESDQFEELCYDILIRNESLGFFNIKWLKGACGQRGRDIEAEKIVSNIPDKRRTEKWIIQCKHYLSQTVGVRDFQDTIIWADNHNPDVVLIMTSSFLSPDSKDLIEGLHKQKRYKIEYMELNDLEKIIKCDLEMIRKYFSGMYNYDKILVTEAHMDDLDGSNVKWFLRKRGISIKNLGKKGQLVNVLRNINAVEMIDGKPIPTVAGVLLFGKNPQKFIPSSIIQIARFRGNEMEKILEMQKINGCLPNIIDECEKSIKKHTKRIKKVGFKTEEAFEYPIEAIGEAIVNAIAHRDYSEGGRNIRVMLFDDRIEIESPGGLPADLTIDNFEGRHFARNEIIAQCLYDAKYMQKFGTGIGRMKELAKRRGLPEPLFKDERNTFTAIFYNNETTEEVYIPKPVPSPEYFVGRKQELEMLIDQLKNEKTVLVSGMAGIGKTSLISRFANEGSRRERSFWFTCSKYHTFGDLVNSLSLFFGNKKDLTFRNYMRYNRADTDKMIHMILNSLERRSYLLFIDNLELLTDENSQDLIINIAKKSMKSKMIFASRIKPKFLERIREKLALIELEGLSLQECNEFLDNAKVTSEKRATEKIYHVTGGHPYALELIGQLTRVMPLEEIITHLESISLRNLDPLLEENYNLLTEKEKQILGKLSIFPEEISYEIMEKIFSSDNLWEILDNLVSSGFINYDAESQLYNLHPLFREFIRERQDSRKLLFESAEDENSTVRGWVAKAVGRNFDGLTEDYRKLLFILSEDEVTEVRKLVALAIVQNFEDLPPEYQGILKKFRSDNAVLKSLKRWIKENERYDSNVKTIRILKRKLDI